MVGGELGLEEVERRRRRGWEGSGITRLYFLVALPSTETPETPRRKWTRKGESLLE